MLIIKMVYFSHLKKEAEYLALKIHVYILVQINMTKS